MDKEKKIISVLLLFVIFYFSSFLQLIPIFLFKIKDLTPSMNVLLNTFSTGCLVIILYFIFRKELKKEWKIFRKDPLEIMNTTFGYWFIGIIIMLISNSIIIQLTGTGGAENEKLVQQMIGALPFVMLIDAGLFAPFNEELIFRKALRKVIDDKWLYVLLSGIIFGLLHVIGSYNNPIDFLFMIPYGALGSAFALAYYNTKTIFSTIFMHMMHNTVLIGLSILIKFVL